MYFTLYLYWPDAALGLSAYFWNMAHMGPKCACLQDFIKGLARTVFHTGWASCAGETVLSCGEPKHALQLTGIVHFLNLYSFCGFLLLQLLF